MYIYDKLNQKNLKHFMEHEYDNDEIYIKVYDAIQILGACGFRDMKELHEFAWKLDSKLYDER